MRSLGYCKKSIYNKIEQWTDDGFRKEYSDYCEYNSHNIQGIFMEDTDETIQKIALLNTLKSGNQGYLVVVPNATHISNDIEELVTFVLEIEKCNSTIICMDYEFPDILQNAVENIPSLGISHIKSKNIRYGMQPRAISGKSLGKSAYGYIADTKGIFQIDDKESIVVTKIYNMYVNDDLGLRKISQILNTEGLVTRNNNPWNIIGIRDILKNSVYIGTYNRFGLRLPKNHTPIVSAEIFRQAQDKSRVRRKFQAFPNTEPYLLSGLCICGYCGKNMMGVQRKRIWKAENGIRKKSTYRYYQCQSRGNQGKCNFPTWSTEKLEFKILKQLEIYASKNILQESMLGHKGEQKLKLATQSRFNNVAKMEKRFIAFVKKTARGESVLARLNLYLQALYTSREQAFISIAPDDVTAFIENWNTADFISRQSFLNEYIINITVNLRSVKIHI